VVLEQVEVKSKDSIVAVSIRNIVLAQLCNETRNLPRVQNSLGDAIASALACAFTKTTGKPITKIQQTQNP
jgi:hypothetical protein